MASPLVFKSGFQKLDTDFAHFRDMNRSPETDLCPKISTNFSLDSTPRYDEESTQENISSTYQSSVANSTLATTFSDVIRDQDQDFDYRAAIGNPSAIECAGKSLSAISHRDPFRKPVCLRKAGPRMEPLYVYPCSCSEISKDYNEHFNEVVFMLRKNIFHAPSISSSFGEDMLYQLLKVGSSPQTAHTAIVTICEEEIYHQVKNVLYEPQLLKDCNLYNPATTQRTLLSWFKKPYEPKNNDPYWPCMPLYVYAGKAVISLHQTLDSTSTNILNNVATRTETMYDFSLCGAKITTADRSGFATMTCVLKVDADYYGLTAAHTFRKDCTSESSNTNSQLWASVEAKCFISLGDHTYPLESSIYLPALSFFNTTTADLDWGLVHLTDDQLIKENAYVHSFCNRLAVTVVAKTHPQTERNVLILSSALSPLRGVLLDEYTYRTTIGNGAAQLWSVEPDDGQGMSFAQQLSRTI